MRTISIPPVGPRDAGATMFNRGNVAVAVDAHFTGFTPLNGYAVEEEEEEGSIVEYLGSC